eukprot:Gregarina_sp_Poly_1__3292@NODE_1945_length_3024_cov_116_019953_g518_i2_p1_GENE_NODE_1945_length_3024_cov_116_019953_g518_i2NODE_1945_length_3024_cov_116_019953_g518_i2_p1_ORF_typecomplete_len986_score207_71Hist_deacetyl/PF00850_19/2_2e57Ank_2/PF12796_7/0_00021Ank_2/PF12796_7/2Ank_5/PF13857_6/5_6e03Ank_5/PF13857_6/0_044Ank_5/PF13857_6/10Ank_4/PF13637_6/0_012Ank_4/PF13637_6/2_8e02EFhand_11/PF08976_11/0_14_NODE_1945_length_3024_cov_116_019953_g518_i2672706
MEGDIIDGDTSLDDKGNSDTRKPLQGSEETGQGLNEVGGFTGNASEARHLNGDGQVVTAGDQRRGFVGKRIRTTETETDAQEFQQHKRLRKLMTADGEVGADGKPHEDGFEVDAESREDAEVGAEEGERESMLPPEEEENGDVNDSDDADEWDAQKTQLLSKRTARRRRLLHRQLPVSYSRPVELPRWTKESSEFKSGALCKAIRLNKVEFVEAFVKSNFAHTVVNDRDKRNQTPLSVAFLKGSPLMIALLLTVKAPIGDETSSAAVSLADIEAALGVENQLPMEDEELQRVDVNEKFLNEVPLIHLLLRVKIIEDSLLILGCLLYNRLASSLDNLANMFKIRKESLIEDDGDLTHPWVQEFVPLKARLDQFLSHLPPLNSEVLDEVNLDAPDYFGASLLWRCASMGMDAHCRLLLFCGADSSLVADDGVDCVTAAISSKSVLTVNSLLTWIRDTESPIPSTVDMIKDCTQFAAWNVLFEIVRSSPEISSEEFELVAQHSDNLGYGTEFLETFRRAIDEEFDEHTNSEFENFLAKSNESRTALVTHEDCLRHLNSLEPHDAGIKNPEWQSRYPENPSRLEVLLNSRDGILKSFKFEHFPWMEDPAPAALADILRVHDHGYIKMIQNKCAEADRAMMAETETAFEPLRLDDDTAVTPSSWRSARAAAGCVISAVQAVCEGLFKNAFCVVRPPGHHVGVWGAAQPPSNGSSEGVDVMSMDSAVGSLGFCLLNNVAIGAAYARYNYKMIKRIAIVDFDIHHGNGTEQIIRHLGKTTRKIELESVSPWGTKLKTFLEVPYYKIWREADDADNIMFVSVHGFDGQFYPATGRDCDESSPRILNISLDGSTHNTIKEVFSDRVATSLMEFHPGMDQALHSNAIFL